MKVVIVGGGIMGCATAFYLRRLHEASSERGSPLEIVIIERCRIACGPSGKAGGFLARNWCQGFLAPLAEKSFLMHEEIAEEFGKDSIAYRKISAFSGKIAKQKRQSDPSGAAKHKTKPKRQDPFNNVFDSQKMTAGALIGNEETTAQVTPWLLTNLLMRESGAEVIFGEVSDVILHSKNKLKITAVAVKGRDSGTIEVITGDEFCFCVGVWTYMLRKMHLKVPKSIGRKVHSVVIKPKPHLLSRLNHLKAAIFTDFNNTEIIVRENGIVYINGSEKGFEKVVEKSDEVKTDSVACEKILGFWEEITSNMQVNGSSFVEVGGDEAEDEIQTEVKYAQSCHLPMVEHDFKGEQLPVLSRVPKTLNGYVCAGHTCWGILLGPISGLIMAELILNNDPNKIVDTTPFKLKQ